MKITKNRISIEELSFRPFNRLELKNVYVEDLQGDTLAYIQTLSASFDIFKMLDDQLLIKSVDVDHFLANISKENPEADFNFQFLIDAFASDEPDEDTPSSLEIKIHDVSIRNGRVNYDILSEPKMPDNEFDFNHIHLKDINSELDINSIDIENLGVTVERFALKEESGLDIDIQIELSSNKQKINIKDFKIILPNSSIKIPEAWIDYTGLELENIAESSAYFLDLDESTLSFGDVKMFYPPIGKLKDKLIFSGKVEGALPKVNLVELSASCGDNILLDASAFIENYNEWETSRLELDLNRFFLSSQGIEDVMKVASDEPMELPINTGDVELIAKLSGSLPDILIQMDAKTDRGAFVLDGSGGYLFKSGEAHFDLGMSTNNFDLETLMQDTIFGVANLFLKAQGSIDAKGNINADACFDIDEFGYNGYAYHSIQGRGYYEGDSIHFTLNSDDKNIPIQAIVSANMGKQNPSANLYLKLDSVFVDALNFISGYEDTYLTATITGNTKGFDPELMNLSLAIDSFFLHTDKGSFCEPHFRMTYQADKESKKNFHLSSRLLSGDAEGSFTYAGIQESLMEAFPILFENQKKNPKKKDSFPQDLNFKFTVQEANSLSQIMQFDTEIPDSALLIGQFSNHQENLELLLSAYTEYFEADTIQLSLLAFNTNDNLSLIFNVDNKSKQYDVDASLDAEIEFIPVKRKIPEMKINFNPSVFVVNDTHFEFHESSVEIKDNYYSVDGFKLDHGEKEYIEVNGIVSQIPEDSIMINISHFEIGTLLGAMKTTDIPISGNANGKIIGKQLLTTPLVLTRDFGINNLVFSENDIGNINIRSAYSTERKGVVLRAALDHADREESVISGLYLPEKDSLSITTKIRDIKLNWLKDMVAGTLYGLDGSINGDIKINGKITDPNIDGYIYFDNAKLGVSMLNTLYSTTDSIHITPDQINLRRFTILDENKKKLTINGRVNHQMFSKFTPNLSLRMNDFLVMNNSHQTDSLFFGRLMVNGRLSIMESGKDWILSGNISHSEKSKIMINIPTTASTATRHNSITFVNSEGEDLDALAKEKERATSADFSFPIKMNVTLMLDQGLTMGAIYNPATGDLAEATGEGLITFNYDLTSEEMSITGDYTVDSGKASLSIANITTKTFTVQPGGKVFFKGDPLATSFNMTALYTLRADLATLDESFENVGMASTRVPVICSVSASGNLEKMDINYDLSLPNETEEIQRKMEGILYTDDDKVMQIAYLLALGRFMPSDMSNSMGGIGNNMAGSIASMGLNTLFNNMFNDNWSIDTNINTAEGGFSDMDVSISTSLLDNRLTVTGTVGYSENSEDNYTGDFFLEYKLIPSGNLALKVYNVTNNQYFEKAKFTQGIGIVYKRGEKTFSDLFKNILGKPTLNTTSPQRSSNTNPRPENVLREPEKTGVETIENK
ncbi:translocation/assembly module TamB domain-containing protein [Bacteroidales bacterium OttesenSCG-928-M11]|nr:translocation/assembly module TamB domain-containing protein [Bacteroidales bacterium OttesenSCG-928-M11]